MLRQLGCDRIIDHTVEDVGSVLKREYLAGVDLVYEGTYASPIRTVHHTGPADQRPSSGCSGVRHVSTLASALWRANSRRKAACLLLHTHSLFCDAVGFCGFSLFTGETAINFFTRRGEARRRLCSGAAATTVLAARPMHTEEM